MTIKRAAHTAVALGAGVVALLTTLVFSAPASFGAVTSASADRAPAVDWGPNHDGWHVEIVNDSSSLLYYSAAPFNNVHFAPATIAAGDFSWVRGVKSIFGGPANMDVLYHRNSPALSFHVFIRSDASGHVTTSCDAIGGVCTVTTAGSNKPIHVVVTSTLGS
jgi:hypothetical protein